MQTAPAVDGGSGGRGEPDQEAEDQNQPLFPFPVFFLNPRRAVLPVSLHLCWGEGCSEWGGRFFFFSSFIHFFNTQRDMGKVK